MSSLPTHMTMRLPLMHCPKCDRLNRENWPLEIDGEIKDGGCQDCWEAESDEEWWKAVISAEEMVRLLNA